MGIKYGVGLFCRILPVVVFASACVKNNTDPSSLLGQEVPSPTSTPVKNPDGSVTLPPESNIGACGVNSPNTTDCLMPKDSYFYSLENGGKNPDQIDPVMVTGALFKILSTGWYAGTTQATFQDTKLKPENIRKDVNLFGVIGTVDTSRPPTCDLASQPVVIPGGGACLMSAGLYAYSSANGGRSQNCSASSGTSISTCWINENRTYFLSPQAETPPNQCQTTDIDNGSTAVAGTCWVPAGHYYYSEAYGGRETLCNTTEAANTTACWADSVSTTNKAVISSVNFGNWCTWNAKTTSACRARINVTIEAGDNPLPESKTYGYVYQGQYGGRDTYCLRDGTGNCWLGVEKSQLEPNLRPENIKAGVMIFGVTGKFRGEGSWKSGAHRDSVANPLSLSDESFVYGGSGDKDSGFPDGYREVPFSELDDEGTYSATSFSVDRTGWGDLVCGRETDGGGNTVNLPPGFTSWTIRARIANCGDVFGSSAVWDGNILGNAGQSKWKLVMRTGSMTSGKGREIWIDENTGMLWSSLISTALNWCKASGSNNIAGNSAMENDPHDICDSSTYQNTAGDAVSACFEGLGFTSAGDVAIDNLGKTGLAQASTPVAVGWRLPTLYDYEVAEYNGIRFVLPDMGMAIKSASGSFFEWTATIDSNNKRQAWVIPSILGGHGLIDRSMTARARCIGRANITQ